MPYLAVDDVDARVAKAVAAGAQLMKPIFEVPNVGRMAWPQEPARLLRLSRRKTGSDALIFHPLEFVNPSPLERSVESCAWI
jgi:hypothetical protein